MWGGVSLQSFPEGALMRHLVATKPGQPLSSAPSTGRSGAGGRAVHAGHLHGIGRLSATFNLGRLSALSTRENGAVGWVLLRLRIVPWKSTGQRPSSCRCLKKAIPRPREPAGVSSRCVEAIPGERQVSSITSGAYSRLGTARSGPRRAEVPDFAHQDRSTVPPTTTPSAATCWLRSAVGVFERFAQLTYNVPAAASR